MIRDIPIVSRYEYTRRDMMRAFITAMLIGLGATSAFGQSGTVAPMDSTNHVGSLLEE